MEGLRGRLEPARAPGGGALLPAGPLARGGRRADGHQRGAHAQADGGRAARARPGVAGKVGELLETIRAGVCCAEQASLMRGFAFGILDPEGERYALALAHQRECPACRAYVAVAARAGRGAAAAAAAARARRRRRRGARAGARRRGRGQRAGAVRVPASVGARALASARAQACRRGSRAPEPARAAAGCWPAAASARSSPSAACVAVGVGAGCVALTVAPLAPAPPDPRRHARTRAAARRSLTRR